jgi:threonine dehydratase
MIPLEWLEQARVRIGMHLRHTPLTYDARRALHLKWENQQVTGSFKARGAFNKVLALEAWEREAGLVAVSAGNHGQGVARAARLSGAQVEVFVPEGAVARKLDSMRELGAQVHTVRGGYAEAEAAGRSYAAQQGKTWISPYNDGQVIAGQGTLALEALQDLAAPASDKDMHRNPTLEWPRTWVVPVGGGGLISGIGAALQDADRRPRLVGVQSEASAFAYSLYTRGSQDGVPDLPSLADGLSGAVESGSVTIPLMREFVDDFVIVREPEIARAIAFAWYEYGETIEGSAAVTLAALMSGQIAARPALAIVSGGNIQPELHARIVAEHAETSWA